MVTKKFFAIATVIVALGVLMLFTTRSKAGFPLADVPLIETDGTFEATIPDVTINGFKRKEVGVLFSHPVKWETKYFSIPFTGQVDIYDSKDLIYSLDLSKDSPEHVIIDEMSAIPSIALMQFPNAFGFGNETTIKIVIKDFKINGETPDASTMRFYYSNSRLK